MVPPLETVTTYFFHILPIRLSLFIQLTLQSDTAKGLFQLFLIRKSPMFCYVSINLEKTVNHLSAFEDHKG